MIIEEGICAGSAAERRLAGCPIDIPLRATWEVAANPNISPPGAAETDRCASDQFGASRPSPLAMMGKKTSQNSEQIFADCADFY